MNILLFLLAQQAPDLGPAPDELPPPIARLIERLGDSEAGRRDEAERAIERFWERWTEADLDALQQAAKGADVERSFRAKKVIQFIHRLRSFATHLLIRVDERGNAFIGGQAGDPESLLTAYSKAPKDPTGNRNFRGLRLWIEAHRDVPFRAIHATLKAAATLTSLAEVALIIPAEPGTLPSEDLKNRRILLFSVPGRLTNDDVDWKNKFLEEVNLHYHTHQFRNAEIEELKAKVARLESLLRQK